MSNLAANNFCSACGNSLIETAVVCPKCGSPTARFALASGAPIGLVNTQGYYTQSAKSKSVAVLLAVFLGFWAFLYTFKKDAGSFWVSVITQLFLIVVVTVSTSGRLSLDGVAFVAFISWLITLISIAARKSEWYSRYPNN